MATAATADTIDLYIFVLGNSIKVAELWNVLVLRPLGYEPREIGAVSDIAVDAHVADQGGVSTVPKVCMSVI